MNSFDMENIDIAWCPGCGNFSILKAIKKALSELGIKRDKLVVSSGIGQGAKTPHYFKTNFFNGLHGRALPVGIGIKAVNPDLVVICQGGDGDMYGEGGNHFIHAIRRNPDLTNIIHNNMVYGLTKGQASPTSQRNFKTPVQVGGVSSQPFDPISVAIALGASFVARAFSGDIEETKDVLKEAISHKGYSLVDIFQPCVSFNKVNTHKWFKENTYYLNDSHDPYDREQALKCALEKEKLPLGIIYKKKDNPVFEGKFLAYDRNLFHKAALGNDKRGKLSKLLVPFKK